LFLVPGRIGVSEFRRIRSFGGSFKSTKLRVEIVRLNQNRGKKWQLRCCALRSCGHQATRNSPASPTTNNNNTHTHKVQQVSTSTTSNIQPKHSFAHTHSKTQSIQHSNSQVPGVFNAVHATSSASHQHRLVSRGACKPRALCCLKL
jgi:hypothetical protein